MNLVETHIIKSKEIEQLCINTKLLYNQSLYYLKQSYFGNIEPFKEYELSGLFAKYNEENLKRLPSNTAQQVIRILFQDWHKFHIDLKNWKQNSNKYHKKPSLPRYKKKTTIAIFTKTQIRVKNGHIYFPKKVNINPIKTNILDIHQVRIIPLATTFKIEIVYDKEINDLNLPKNNILSLDLGLNNIVTSINNIGLPPFIINGKIIKSFNHWYNKKRATLQSKLPINKYTSKKIHNLEHYRNCWIGDKIHKISKFIINYCIKNNIGTIIIGKNKGWKNKINLGKKINQKFTEIPHAKLISKIQYKGKLVGISIEVVEESYTSKCDALLFEPLMKQEKYLGQRTKRGLFQSGSMKILNADVNGAINIARKVIGDSVVTQIINSGNAFLPYKVNIL